jgi:hypothetical protein
LRIHVKRFVLLQEEAFMRKILSLSLLAVLFSFTPAIAAEGPYLGAGAVYNDPVSSDINDIKPAYGYDFKLGYNFGTFALEGNIIGSSHGDKLQGFGTADFSGFSLDARIFASPFDDPNQFYFLIGLGAYSIDQFNPSYGDTTLDGSGFNFGAGLEHYFNDRISLNVGVLYRIIKYDEFDVGGRAYSANIKGDTLSVETGLNFHF